MQVARSPRERGGTRQRTLYPTVGRVDTFACAPCVLLYSSVRKTVTPPPPTTHTFLKRPFLTDCGKYTHTLPKVTTFWCIRPKVEKNLKKCEFAPCWLEMNVPERFLSQNNLGELPRLAELLLEKA